MSASIDRFLATGDAAKMKKTKTPATIRRVGLRCTNCGGSHHTVSCPYEKKKGGLHADDGTKIRACSVCHKPGHTKRNCPELANFGTHNVPDELPDVPVVVVGERSLDERLKADRAKAEREGRVVDLTDDRPATKVSNTALEPARTRQHQPNAEFTSDYLPAGWDERSPSHATKDRDSDDEEEGHVVRRAEQWRNHLREGGERDRAAWDRHFGDTDKEHQNKILQRVRGHDN